MEVVLMVHPAGRRYRHGGGECVLHLSWSGTGHDTEPRGTSEGRDRMIENGWFWELNAVQMPMSWHCYTILWPDHLRGNRTLV